LQRGLIPTVEANKVAQKLHAVFNPRRVYRDTAPAIVWIDATFRVGAPDSDGTDAVE
jgi:hypothetical protein